MRFMKTFLIGLGLSFFFSCSNSDFAGSNALRDRSTRLKLEVTPGKNRINVGESFKLTATAIFPDSKKRDVTKEAIWQSSAADLATVDKLGQVQALKVGLLSATASFEDATASASVEVVDLALIEIKVMPEKETIYIEDYLDYQAFGVYSDGMERDITANVTWKTGDPTTATFGQVVEVPNKVKGLKTA